MQNVFIFNFCEMVTTQTIEQGQNHQAERCMLMMTTMIVIIAPRNAAAADDDDDDNDDDDYDNVD